MIYGAHISHMTQTYSDSIWSGRTFLFTPYLAFFFIRSGYFHRKSSNTVWSLSINLLRKRLLMIFPFAFIGFVCSIIISNNTPIYTVLSNCKWFIVNGNFPSNGPLWFITTLVLCELLIIYIDRTFISLLLAVIISLIGCCVVIKYDIHLNWNIQNIFICMFFYIIGILYKKWEKMIPTFLCLLFMPIIILNMYYNDSYIDLYNSELKWGGIFYFLLNSIFFIISFSTIYNRYINISNLAFNFIGSNSMVYYALHFPILLMFLHFIPSIIGSELYAFYLFALIMLFCTIYTKFSKQYPIMVGHHKYRRKNNQ